MFCSKIFTYIDSFNPHNMFMNELVLLPHFIDKETNACPGLHSKARYLSVNLFMKLNLRLLNL